MKSLIRKWLLGDTVFSAYVNVSITDQPAQQAWLQTGTSLTNVSDAHWILCIEPIIFGVWVSKDFSGDGSKSYRINFGRDPHEAEALVKCDLFGELQDETGKILLLRLRHSDIRQLNFLKRFLIYSRYYNRDGLTYGRFKEYVCAYSYPRRIRVVSFRDGDYQNIFPMDLLGGIPGTNRFIFGLRHTNIALAKIIECKKLAVCEVSSRYKETIYLLGKHHSSMMPTPSNLGFEIVSSNQFAFPIPAWVQDCKEVTILKTMNLGSHMLLLGEIVDATIFSASSDHLHLVHLLHFLERRKGRHSYRQIP